jgi:hypothetical protein
MGHRKAARAGASPRAAGRTRTLRHPLLRLRQVPSKFVLADFYGRVLIAPTTVEHTRPALDAAVAQVRQAFAEHHLLDGLVAIERTGRYHRLVQRPFAAAGFETCILHHGEEHPAVIERGAYEDVYY